MVPKDQPRAFSRNSTEVCPSCIERNAVDIIGRVRKPPPIKTSQKTRDGRPKWLFAPSKAKGCEMCNGTGRVARAKPGDPYWLGRAQPRMQGDANIKIKPLPAELVPLHRKKHGLV